MIVKIADRATLMKIRPSLMAAYLRASGWDRATHESGRYSMWIRPRGERSEELLLPLSKKLGDFAERMAELLGALQRVEERSQLAILRDVETTSSDVFRFREQPPTSLIGTIGIEEGARLFVLVRDLLLYGAMLEHSPSRQSIAGRRPDEVERFMGQALLGQTEASSFVVRAQVPVPGAITKDLFPEHAEPGTEPFERRAGVRLMRMLCDTKEAAADALETGDYRSFSEVASGGAALGLFSSLVAAQELAPSSPLEISCSWAPSRPAVGQPPGEVTIEPDLAEPIREAVRILRPSVPAEDTQLVGAVELLRRDAQEELIGELAMTTLVEGRVRNVHFNLEKPDYNLAIQAFQDRVPLAVIGDLVKEGRYWRLKRPRDVRILDKPDDEV